MIIWKRVNPIQSSETVLLPSTFQQSSMLVSSGLSKLVLVCLFSSMYFRGTGIDDLEERIADREVQHDDGRYNLPTLPASKLALPIQRLLF